MSGDSYTIGLLITNRVDRQLLGDFLRQVGYRVCDIADDGDADGLEDVSLIIADPGAARAAGNRLMVLQWKMRATFLPFLIVLPQKADSVPWLRAGFDDVLRLPVTKAELEARLKVFLRLREHSAEQYRAMFENALIGIYRESPDGRILMANPALVRMLGYSSLEEMARERAHGPAESKFANSFSREQLDREGHIIGVESSLIRRDGSVLFVRESARAIRDEAGKTLYYEGTVEDITERKMAEEERMRLLTLERAARAEAEAANRAKDEFLGILSHELRTPLTSMLGWTRMLRMGMLDEATVERALESIERNAKLQAQLIEDLLDISRIIAGKLKLDVRPIEPAPVVQAAIDAVRHAAEAKDIKIHSTFDPEADFVLADLVRLQQIVWNLLSNAIKFSAPGGSVDLVLQRVDSNMRIIVKDSGRGIKPEFLPHVFDRFRQADAAITRQYGGLGLGLAIVRHLVELHGGAIRAESEGEGKGATFIVTIPLTLARDGGSGSKQKSALIKSEAALAYPSGVKGLRVLVVDDDLDTLDMISSILEQCEAQVRATTSPAEALQSLNDVKPDVLISDIGMPGEDGYSLIRKVKQVEKQKGWRIPCVALTAFAGKEDRTRALAAGFQAHLAKPVDLDELLDIVAELSMQDGKKPEQ